MIEIEVKKHNIDHGLIWPLSMFKYPYGTIFQEYCGEKPTNVFYMSPMLNEDYVFCFWFYPEEQRYVMSANNRHDFKCLNERIRVKKVDAKVKIRVEI